MYKPKTLFTGYKIGKKSADLYVGVPDKYWKGRTVTVQYKNDKRLVMDKDVVTTRTFHDKFRPGKKYELRYVLWEKK